MVTPMDPIPETAEALDELDPPLAPNSLLSRLTRLTGRAQELVPDLLGVSISPFPAGLTFTLVASGAEVATLDGVQYAAGGPCVGAAHEDRLRTFDTEDVLDEERWRLFAEASSAHRVRSTLTLPVREDRHVVGTVNLYATSPRAFVGHHEDLSRIFGSWAVDAVTNADLSFSTRAEAQAAPGLLREQAAVDLAVGILAADLDVDVDTAESRLRDAAVRAGVPLGQLAREIAGTRGDGDRPRP